MNYRSLLVSTSLVMALSCGDDGGSGASASGAGAAGCKRGAYPGGAGTLTLCGTGVDDDGCVPLDKFAGYTSYGGDIAVYPGTDPNLSALSCLREVGRITVGSSEALQDLSGLDNVEKATALLVLGNDKLTSLHGIAKLRSVVQLTINNNDGLVDIVGLPAGFSASGVNIEINRNLKSLEGLEGLEVRKRISIESNRSLSKCVVDAFLIAYSGLETLNLDNLEPCP